MIVAQQMLVLFIIMLVGFIAYKKDIINDETSKKLSSIVVNISNPALILSSIIGDNNTIEAKELVSTMGIAILMFIILILLSLIIPRLIKANKADYNVYKLMTVFSNIGFIGFPIISSVYGSGALLYASIFLIPYNVLIYTYGIQIMTADKQSEEKATSSVQEIIKKVLNIGVVACFIAIILFIFKIQLPSWMASSITMLSNLTAPLSVMVIGASFAVINIKEVISDKQLILFAFIKQLVLPIIGAIFVNRLIGNELVRGIVIIMLSMPVGSMTAMLAQEHDANYELTSKAVALTTMISVVTIPLVSYIAEML